MGVFPRPQQNNLLAQMQSIRQLMGGNPQQMMLQAMQSNPQMYQQFQQFMRDNQGKTPEQVAQENGIDFNEMVRLFQ